MSGIAAEILAQLDRMRPKHPLEAEGWRYTDPPGRFSPEFWQKFLAILGEGEYLILAESSGVGSGGQPWHRGQLMISPAGQRNLSAWLAAGTDGVQ